MTKEAARSYHERAIHVRLLKEEILVQENLMAQAWEQMSEEERALAEEGTQAFWRAASKAAEELKEARKRKPPTFHDIARDPSVPLGAKLDLMGSELQKDLDESARRLDEAFAKAELIAMKKGATQQLKEIRAKRLKHREENPKTFRDEDLEELSEHLSGDGAWLGKEEEDERREQTLLMDAISQMEDPNADGPWRCCGHGKFRPGRCPYCFSHIKR